MEGKTHTFGGSHLDRFLIDYEVSEADVLGSAPAAVEAPPAAEPVAAPPAASAEPAWAPSREEWDQTQQFMGAIIEALQNEEGDVPRPEGAPDLSTPEAAQRYIDEIAQQKAETIYKERMEPYMPVLEKITRDESKALVLGELDKIAKGDPERGIPAIGDFDREYAAELAHAYFVQGVAPEKALQAAAERTLALQNRHLQQGAEAERGQMQNRLDAPQTPAGIPGTAVDAPASPLTGRDKYEQAAADWLNGRRTSTPIG